jgi:hypothetical protein
VVDAEAGEAVAVGNHHLLDSEAEDEVQKVFEVWPFEPKTGADVEEAADVGVRVLFLIFYF